MRYLIVTMLYLMFVNPMWVASQNVPGDISKPLTPPAVPSAEDKLKDESNQQTSQDRSQKIETELKELAQQLAPIKSEGFWLDICNDGNGLSFHRLQVVMWTVILGMVFVSSVVVVISMPEFPDTLLVLLGISAGTYLGFKFPEKS